MSDLTQEYVKTLFDYKDGMLVRKIRVSNAMEGQEIKCVTKDGYSKVSINHKDYLTHRIIFLWNHGYLPKIVDHIDGNPSNNKIENLREANDQNNCYNSKLRSDNISGFKGVSWNKDRNKWVVRINTKKKLKQWYVDDLEFASFLAVEARSLFHGEYARHV